jgi:hypothetical protein
MVLEVEQDNVEDLVQSHNREFITEDLQKLTASLNSGEKEQHRDDTMPLRSKKV